MEIMSEQNFVAFYFGAESINFLQTGLPAFAKAGDITTIVTDTYVPEKELSEFLQMGVRVFIAE